MQENTTTPQSVPEQPLGTVSDHPRAEPPQLQLVISNEQLLKLVLSIVGAVAMLIITFVGFTIVQVLNLNSNFSRLDERITMSSTAQAERMDRFAAALPEMGRVVAREELDTPIEAAIFSSKPITDETLSTWVSLLYVADPGLNQLTTYKFELGTDFNDAELYMRSVINSARIFGEIYDVEYVSFTQLEDWSREVNDPLIAPASFDKDASLVFREYPQKQFSPELAAEMVDAWLALPVTATLVSSGTLITDTQIPIEWDWENLVEELNTNPEYSTFP